MDCYEIEVQRLHNLIEEQVYATWISYSKAVAVTNNKMFDWVLPSWSSSSYGRYDLMLFSSPGSSKRNKFLRRLNLTVEHGTMSDSMGTRPALIKKEFL